MNTPTNEITLRHRADCSSPKPEHATASRGASILKCATCGRFVVLNEDGTRAPAHVAIAAVAEPSPIRPTLEASIASARVLGVPLWGWNGTDLVRIA